MLVRLVLLYMQIALLVITKCKKIPLKRSKVKVISREDHHDHGGEELCRYNGHIVGQWVKYDKPTPQSKAFYCCGVLDNDYQWNEDICGHVKGMSPLNFNGISDKPMAAFDRACNQEKLRNERLNASLVESYVWEPFFCNLIPWDGVKFCELLGQ